MSESHDIEQIAQLIAKGIGYDWETLYANKSEWTADRGSRHDINTPRKPDFIEAARAILPLIRAAEARGAVDMRERAAALMDAKAEECSTMPAARQRFRNNAESIRALPPIKEG